MIFDDHLSAFQKALPSIIRELAVESRNFFDESWSNKGFTDSSLTPWKPVLDKDGNIKQRPLVGKGAGILRRSLRTEVNGLNATIYSEIPYAQIHNEGGVIKKKARKATLNFRINRDGRSRFAKAKKANFQQDVTIGAHNITMPQRQFMGSSEKLEQIHLDIITRHLNKIINAS